MKYVWKNVLCVSCVLLHDGCRLYTTHIMSAADFSHLRHGTRVLVFNAHLFSMSQVLLRPLSSLLLWNAPYLYFFLWPVWLLDFFGWISEFFFSRLMLLWVEFCNRMSYCNSDNIPKSFSLMLFQQAIMWMLFIHSSVTYVLLNWKQEGKLKWTFRTEVGAGVPVVSSRSHRSLDGRNAALYVSNGLTCFSCYLASNFSLLACVCVAGFCGFNHFTSELSAWNLCCYELCLGLALLC